MFCTNTKRNFQKVLSYMSYGGNVVKFLFTFFHCRSFFTLKATSISHFLTATTNFHVVLPTRFVSFVFLSLTLALCPSDLFLVELHLLVAYFLLFSDLISFSIFQICGHDNPWFATTWQGGHVEWQYNRIFPWRIYMKIEERNAFVLFIQDVIDCMHIKRPLSSL